MRCVQSGEAGMHSHAGAWEREKPAEVHVDIGIGSEVDEPVAGYADDIRIGQLGQ